MRGYVWNVGFEQSENLPLMFFCYMSAIILQTLPCNKSGNCLQIMVFYMALVYL